MRETGKGGIGEYLRKQVGAAGGMCEKVKREGRRGGPDYEVTWRWNRIHLIETKWPNGKPSKAQQRDHARRAELGVGVWVLDTKEKIDKYIGDWAEVSAYYITWVKAQASHAKVI